MVTIEKYAELCALMKDTAGDASKEEASNAIKVAEEAILILEKKLKLRLES